MTTVWIVRHGATRMNNTEDTSADRIRGWSDVPLTDQGRQEAVEAARKLQPIGIGSIVSSDLARAEETAAIIGKALGLTPDVNYKLRPWDVGIYTGIATKQALPRLAMFVRTPDKRVPKGETFNSFKTRAFQGLAEAMAKHAGRKLLIVTHHRDERLFMAWDAAGQPPDLTIKLDIFLQKGDPPGGIKTIDIQDGVFGAQGGDDMAGFGGGGGGNQRGAMFEAMRQRAGGGGLPSMAAGKFGAALGGMPKGGGFRPSPAPSMGGGMGGAGMMAHGRAIAGAHALHAVGHIGAGQRDQYLKSSRNAIAGMRKPKAPATFGSLAPSGLSFGSEDDFGGDTSGF